MSNQAAERGRWELTGADLDPGEQAIYQAILAKLSAPSPDQERMAACYARAAAELAKAKDNHELAAWLQKCLVYARNKIGLWKPQRIFYLELLFESGESGRGDWPEMVLYLDPKWEWT